MVGTRHDEPAWASIQDAGKQDLAVMLSFHHIGVACASVEAEFESLKPLGYVEERPIVEDPIQKVRALFVLGGGPRLELVEPASPDSPIRGFIKRGQKFYHMGYEVPDMGEAIGDLERRDYRLLTATAPGSAFDMRQIVFMISPTLTIIELIGAL